MNKDLAVGAIAVIALALVGTMIAATLIGTQSVYGSHLPVIIERKAPTSISGDNVYVTWWSNKTGNWEVLFRASTDGGKTFSDKINLSNTTGSDSLDAQLAAEGKNVIVTWWERTHTTNEPVAKMSTDNGKTFGPLLKLSTNGTIGSSGGS
jgi:hypothetical protein